MSRFRQRCVQGPSGIRWRIGRRWIRRGLPRWRKVRVGKPAPGDAAEATLWSISDAGGLDELAAGLAILVGVLVVAVVLIPLLLFGIELIIAGLVIAAGILGRGLLGRPWVVEATSVGDAGRSLTWSVVGWRRAGRLIDEVATSLTAGLEPAPAEAAEVISTGATASVPAEGQPR
jgi:hypothetical protein